MKRIIRLTENDLTRIVSRVISEQKSNLIEDRTLIGKKYKFNYTGMPDECVVERAFKIPEGNEFKGYLILPSTACRKNGIVNGEKGYVWMSGSLKPGSKNSVMTSFEWEGNDWKMINSETKNSPRYKQPDAEFL